MPRFVQGVAVGHEDRGRRARFRLLVSRKRLVGTLALVLLAGLATRYARDRPGQSVLIGHSIDRSTIAYQLSAASPEEIKELVALQRSLTTERATAQLVQTYARVHAEGAAKRSN